MAKVTHSRLTALEQRAQAALAKTQNTWGDPPSDERRAAVILQIIDGLKRSNSPAGAALEQVWARSEELGHNLGERVTLTLALVRYPQFHAQVEATLAGDLALADWRHELDAAIIEARRERGLTYQYSTRGRT